MIVFDHVSKVYPNGTVGLDDVSLRIDDGEFVAIIGRSGAGKSTLLRAVNRMHQITSGTLTVNGTDVTGLSGKRLRQFRRGIGMVFQSFNLVTRTSVIKNVLAACVPDMPFWRVLLGAFRKEDKLKALESLGKVGILDKAYMRADQLSGGQQQRVALARAIVIEPDILLMDEPTKGLDAEFKQSFAAMVRSLLSGGVTVLMVSHDVEFCARYAHRCALFFDGSISAEGTPRAFFGGNSFYTTSADRMARGLLPHAVTAEDVMAGIGGTVPPEPEVQHTYAPLPPAAEESADWKPPKLPWWRRALAAVSGAVALVILWMATRKTDLTALVGGGKVSAAGWQTLATYGVFLVAMFVLVASIGRRAPPPVQVQTPVEKRKLSRRTVVASVLILLMIPVTLVVCVGLFGRTHYYITALLVMLECMLPFFMVFEGRRPQARELTIIAVLCALGVAGRAAFFMLPQFKPVMALTIIAGVALGGETGFLVGAMTMLASNVLFSQGPWTPFQMFSMGIIGFLAGVLFRKGWLRRSRGALAVFGGIVTFVIYGAIMNPVSALIYGAEMNWQTLLTYYITGFPMDCVHACATVIFLLLLAEPMLEKLDRIKTKYGLVE